MTEAATAPHAPVLLAEVLELLAPRAGQIVVDCTAGAGGHLRALAEAVGPTGRVIALDRDERAFLPDAAGGVAATFPQVTLVRSSFGRLPEVLAELGVDRVDGVLADLGVSSMQLDEGPRGFSFREDAPLDMRMDTSRGPTCAELIAELDEKELADVLYHYGEERRSRPIARALKRVLPTTTAALVAVVESVLGPKRGRIHPATRTFQALRIATNRELDELDALLAALPDVLAPGGRAAIISFHSLEDRKVKQCFQGGARRRPEEGGPLWALLTKKPRVADDEEVARNVRSRSAKLRVLERNP